MLYDVTISGIECMDEMDSVLDSLDFSLQESLVETGFFIPTQERIHYFEACLQEDVDNLNKLYSHLGDKIQINISDHDETNLDIVEDI